jgi:hypothetical protein
MIRLALTAQPAGATTSIHTAAMWFVDSRGRVAGLVPAGTTVAPSAIVAKLRSLRSWRSQTAATSGARWAAERSTRNRATS